MDATDIEAFDKFVEKHWGKHTYNETSSSISWSSRRTKKRGRRKKTEDNLS